MKNNKNKNPIIEQHIHGGYGVDFLEANIEEIQEFLRIIKEKHNVVGILPTFATSSISKINRQMRVFKEVIIKQRNGKRPLESRVLGIHLEGIFINPKKAGIHNKKLLLPLTIENFNKIENHEILKIVTLAPELDKNFCLTKYLKNKNIIVQIGHSTSKKTYSKEGISGVAHIFNAMNTIYHRGENLILNAMYNKDIYTEIISDGVHHCEEIYKLFFNIKNKDKIILISDALPISHCDKESIVFCNQKIYKNGKNKSNDLAGSVMFVDEIIEYIVNKKFVTSKEAQQMSFNNIINYLNLNPEEIKKLFI